MTELEKVIYPFVYPKLKGKDWERRGHTVFLYRVGGIENRRQVYAKIDHEIQLLYMPDGKYNANFLMHEIEPRLRAERVALRFGFAGDNYWYVDLIDKDEAYGNPDPMKAVGEYLGLK